MGKRPNQTLERSRPQPSKIDIRSAQIVSECFCREVCKIVFDLNVSGANSNRTLHIGRSEFDSLPYSARNAAVCRGVARLFFSCPIHLNAESGSALPEYSI